MAYKQFEITVHEPTRTVVTLTNDEGRIWVRIGDKENGIDVRIKQTDDGLGIIVDAFDAETCEQELGSMQLWYDNINKD